MSSIIYPDSKFQFDGITLNTPTSSSGGTYLSKMFLYNTDRSALHNTDRDAIHNTDRDYLHKKPLYIQTPKCKTKQGIVKNGKRMHIDLVFTNDDEEFIEWAERLETKVRQILFANKDKWFDVELTEDDIESYFSPVLKVYKSGKQYLMRVNAQSNIKIYDEAENDVQTESIGDSTELISILEIIGVKCSAKSFQIDFDVKQLMVIKPQDLFGRCIINTHKSGVEKKSIVKASEPEPVLEEKMPILFDSNNKNDEKKENEQMEKDTHIENNEIEKPNEIEKTEEKNSFTIEADSKNENIENKSVEKQSILDDSVIEINFDNDDLIASTDTLHLKEKTEMYYEMYREARRKAKLAKSLALSSFMEARRIKNLYMLDDIDDSDSDLDDLEEQAVDMNAEENEW